MKPYIIVISMSKITINTHTHTHKLRNNNVSCLFDNSNIKLIHIIYSIKINNNLRIRC